MGFRTFVFRLAFFLSFFSLGLTTPAEAGVGKFLRKVMQAPLACANRVGLVGSHVAAQRNNEFRTRLGLTLLEDRANPAVPPSLLGFDAQVVSVDLTTGTEQVAISWQANPGNSNDDNLASGVELTYPDGSSDVFSLDSNPVVVNVGINSAIASFSAAEYNNDGFSNSRQASVDTTYDAGTPPPPALSEIQIVASSVDTSSAFINWSSSVSGVSAQTLNYSDGFSNFSVEVATNDSGYTLTNLSPGTGYTVFLSQRDSNGNIFYSRDATFSTEPLSNAGGTGPGTGYDPGGGYYGGGGGYYYPAPTPAASSLTVSTKGTNSVTLTIGNSDASTAYYLQQAPFGTQDFTTVKTVSGIEGAVTVSSLAEYARYSFRLVDIVGQAPDSNIVSIRTDFKDKINTTGLQSLWVATAAQDSDGIAVHVYSGNTEVGLVHAFAGTQSLEGGVYVAIGDFNGDGAKDIIVGAGKGGTPRVQVISGKDGSTLFDQMVLEPSFTGGVQVASMDLNHDGYAEIITGTGVGGGPRVVIIDGKTGNRTADFFAYEDSFRGGVQVGTGMYNGRTAVITGTGAGGGPRARVFDGTTLQSVYDDFVYESSLRTGVYVSLRDFNGDGQGDIVGGNGVGGGPRVVVIDGATHKSLASFFAGDSADRTGVVIATSSQLGKPVIAAGGGIGSPSKFTVYSLDGAAFYSIDLGELGKNGVRLGGI